MTKSEAREILIKREKCDSELCFAEGDCMECKYNTTDKEWNEAFEKALEALEEPEQSEKQERKTIPDSIREAVLNVLDDYADKTLEIESGAYERARYAMSRILDGCEWKTESFDTVKDICEKAHEQSCDAVRKILEG